MYLSSLEVSGFKSHENVVINNLHSHLNCISGPNGSGKSNILDAICFALGDDYNNLRVSKYTDLFSRRLLDGNKEINITLHLSNNRPLVAAFPLKSYSLSVKLTPSSPSRTYKLNGKTLTSSQLKRFLSLNKIDVSSALMVVRQSTITSLCMDKTNLLAQYISVASGAAAFSNSMISAETEIEKSLVHVNEIKSHISLLENLLQGEQRQRECLEQKAQLIIKLEEQKNLLNVLNLNELNSKAIELASQCSNIDTEISNLVNELTSNEASFDNLSTQIPSLQATIEDLESSLELLGNDNLKQQQSLSCAEAKLTSLQNQKSKHIKEWNEVSSRIFTISNKIDEISSSIITKQSHLESVTGRLSALNVEENTSNAIDELKRNRLISDYQTRLTQIDFEISEISEQLEQAAHEGQVVSSLEEERKRLMDNMTEEQLFECINQQQLVVNGLGNAESIQPVTSVTMPCGINYGYGTVGSLLQSTVFGEYSTVVNRLLGGVLEVIVADTYDEASKIIESSGLRNVRLWALERINKTATSSFEKLPQNLRQCCLLPTEVVKFLDPKFNPLFNMICSNTVIALNDSFVSDLLTYNFKVITLDGLVHTNSSVSCVVQSNNNNRVEKYIENVQMYKAFREIESKRRQDAEHYSQAVKKLHQLQNIKVSVEKINSKLTSMIRFHDIASIDQQLKMLNQERDCKLEQLQLLTQNQNSSMNQLMDALKAEEKQLNLEIGQLQSQLISNTNTLNSLREKTNQTEVFEEMIADVTLNIEELTRRICIITSQQHETREQLTALKLKSESIRTTLRNTETLLVTLRQQLSEQKKARKELQQKKQGIDKILEKSTLQSLATTDLTVDQVQETINQIEKKIDALNSINEEVLNIPPAEVATKKALLDSFYNQLELINTSIDKLKDGIATYKRLISKANQSIISAVESHMIGVLDLMLPAKKFRIIVDDYLNLKKVNIEVSNGSDQVYQDVTSLSGGQKTIVSACFLLSLAKASGCGIYLLDEIDAALDETHQLKLGQLIAKELVNTQVLCVSHSTIFQKFFPHHVSIQMTDTGSKVL
ncbi:hypothetical protein RCL1_005670 [Eukaryota sp. TZLM3-RCL]